MAGDPVAWLVVWGEREDQRSLHLDHARATMASAAHHGQIDYLVRGSQVALMLQAARDAGYQDGIRRSGRQDNDH